MELRQQIARRAAKGETPYAIAKAPRIDRHTAAKYAGCHCAPAVGHHRHLIVSLRRGAKTGALTLWKRL